MQAERLEEVLFPGLNIVVRQVVISKDNALIDATGCGPPGVCPRCRHPAARVHSRYWRHVAGLPVAGQAMLVRLRVRRFFVAAMHGYVALAVVGEHGLKNAVAFVLRGCAPWQAHAGGR